MLGWLIDPEVETLTAGIRAKMRSRRGSQFIFIAPLPSQGGKRDMVRFRDEDVKLRNVRSVKPAFFSVSCGNLSPSWMFCTFSDDNQPPRSPTKGRKENIEDCEKPFTSQRKTQNVTGELGQNNVAKPQEILISFGRRFSAIFPLSPLRGRKSFVSGGS